MKLADKYIILIHSYVDLITNSSTELYISATKHTLESVRQIIDSVLSMGGSQFTADDLFTFELKKDEDEYYDQCQLLVKCKDEESEMGKATAKLLSNLTGLFNIDAEYDG